MRSLRVVCALIAAIALLSACGGDGGDGAGGGDGGASEPAADAGGGDGASMTIADFMFSAVTAAPGAEVAVSNSDDVPHTVTADDGSFDVRVEPGAEGTFTAPGEAGDYAIACKIHPDMKGTVTVS